MKKTNLQAALLLATPEELDELGIDTAVVEKLVAPVIDLSNIGIERKGERFIVVQEGKPIAAGSVLCEAGETLVSLVRTLPNVFKAIRQTQVQLNRGEAVPAGQTLAWLAGRLIEEGIEFEDEDTKKGRQLLRKLKEREIEREQTDSAAAPAQEAASDGVGAKSV